ncbi:putative RNA-directed DNA polymerase [Tanacetum coccineum]
MRIHVFFHGIINHRLNRARINGLNIHGDWVSEPVTIKNHIFDFFNTRFKEESSSRPTFSSNLFNRLNLEEMQYLDGPFSSLEIKEAVWDCGSDKAPRPDGFTFKFIKKHWNLIEDDIISYVKEFEASSFILKGCNSSFITLVPKVDDPLTTGDFRAISLIGCQYNIISKVLANCLSKVISSVVGEVQTAFIKKCQIIDGPLMVDEIISWARKQKRRLMLFKVDFEKAFDSLSWNFLLSIMEQMGFSSKWRNWILSCLNSSFASVLINGSPTMEFKLERGLRQSDPLSTFLFIIAVEALNIAILEATNRNIFYGFKVGKEKVHISHLKFADDALFLGEWSLSNAKNLSRILTCFYLAFGLKVNFNKSKLFGIRVSNLEVNSFASSVGCLASHLPGSYLGLPIGAKMSRCANWKPLVERFQKRLSKWKANTLSSGGRLTLIRKFFWGDFSDVKKISWIAWDKVLSPRNKGGSGIGRLSTSNHSLLAKWWWRFRTEEHALWCKVIRSIHGVSGGLIEDSNTSTSSGPWRGAFTCFFPRLYRLESNPNCLVCERNTTASPHLLVGHVNGHGHVTGPGRVTSSVIHPNSFQQTPVGLSFNWAWIRRPYTVGEHEELIILTNLIANLHQMPKKTSGNLHMGLQDRSQLTVCETSLPLIHILQLNYEWKRFYPAKHKFIHCKASSDTWKAIFWWVEISRCPPESTSVWYDHDSMADEAPITSNQSKYFDVVVHAAIRHLWNYKIRNKKTSLNWLDWFSDPCDALSSSSSL